MLEILKPYLKLHIFLVKMNFIIKKCTIKSYLNKTSLAVRYGVRKRLLNLGLVGWLGGVHLQGWEKHREYSLEYSTALLMNLSLHRYWLLSSIFRLLSSIFYLLSSIFYLLSSIFYLLSSIFLSSIFYLLSSIFYLLYTGWVRKNVSL